MSSESNNPLSQFFRQPAIYVKLPSGGRWWADGTLNLPINGEIPVSSMTAKDELLLKTPDALMNGQGMVEVIQSCCPNIKDAWKMPSVDVDAVLIAIRIATYGGAMEFESKCPHCGEKNDHKIELSSLIDQIKLPNYKNSLDYNNLKFKFHPQAYYDINKSNSINFEEQKLANILGNTEGLSPEVKAIQLNNSINRLVDLSIQSLTNSTEFIELDEDRKVTNPDFIKEFYSKADAKVIKSIQDKLNEINEEAKLKPMSLLCNECRKDYKVDLTFDYSNFFGNGS